MCGTYIIYVMEYYLALKKKDILQFAKTDVKWNKPHTERKILSDLTYMLLI